MPTYGLTETGFVKKPLEVIEAEMATAQRANIQSDLDNGAGSIIGQVNSIAAASDYELWEVLEAIAAARDPASAEGKSQDDIGAISGVSRDGARKALVVCTLDLDAATTVLAGKVVSEAGNANNRFVLKADVVSTTADQYPGTFESETTGAHPANAGTITVIETTVTGWNSVTNPEDVVPGADVESDPSYRVRREEVVAGQGAGGTVAAVRAALDALDEVVSVTVRENTDWVTVDGMPPKSIEAIIQTNESPVPSDLFAQTIWDAHGGGIKPYGTSSGTATDSNGDSQTVGFSITTEVSVWLEIDIEYDPETYPDDGDDLLKAAVVAFGDALPTGSDVILAKLYPAILGIAGVEDITEIRAGLSASPAGTVNLAMGVTQRADYDTSRILVTKVTA